MHGDKWDLYTYMKLYEQLGEAGPQVTISLIFFLYNMNHIYAHEMSLFGIPTTLWSIIFSTGSLLMGVVNGMVATCRIPKARNYKRRWIVIWPASGFIVGTLAFGVLSIKFYYKAF